MSQAFPPPYPAYPPPPRAPFELGAAISWAWRKFTANWQAFVIAMLGPLLVTLVVNGVYFATVVPLWLDSMRGNVMTDADGLAMFKRVGLLYAVLFVLSIPLSILHANLVRAALLVADGGTPSVRMMFSLRRAGRVMITSLVLTLGTLLGMVLCYLPGLAFAAFSSFTMLFLVDQDLKTVAAIKASFSLVRAHLGLALLTVLVVGVLAWAGALACLIGIVVSVPVAILTQAYAYRALIQGRVLP